VGSPDAIAASGFIAPAANSAALTTLIKIGTHEAVQKLRYVRYYTLSSGDSMSSGDAAMVAGYGIHDVEHTRRVVLDRQSQIAAAAQAGMLVLGHSLIWKRLLDRHGAEALQEITESGREKVCDRVRADCAGADVLLSLPHAALLYGVAVHESAHACVAEHFGYEASWFLQWDARELSLSGRCITSQGLHSATECRVVGLAGVIGEMLLADRSITAEELHARIRLPRVHEANKPSH
jgi:hypothetical protein